MNPFEAMVSQLLKTYSGNYSDEDISTIVEVFKRSFDSVFKSDDDQRENFTVNDVRSAVYLFEQVLCAWSFAKIAKDEEGKELGIDELTKRAVRGFTSLASQNTQQPGLPGAIKNYDPLVSVLRLSEKYFENINRPLSHTNPAVSLINDIFETIFRKIAGFCQMLTLGLYSDAYVSWRTLHEAECIVKLLVDGGEEIRHSYVTHIAYNNAYRNKDQFSQEDLDEVFAEIKGEMKEHGLKSKDMKKFIEYGWLYKHPDYDPNDPLLKLNFRDGVEKLAGLRRYSKIYEGASEIAHSSSAFFYVNDAFCKDLSLTMCYQTYLRIGELYMKYMSSYFKLHPEEEKKALAQLEDCKIISAHLDKQMGPLEDLEEDEPQTV